MKPKRSGKKRVKVIRAQTQRSQTSGIPLPQLSADHDAVAESCRRDSTFYIVAIGASAGGLEAFEQFFKNMPEDSNMAFVLIPHLSPDHKSIMPELLSRHTTMNVVQTEDGMKVQPNSVYIIPPDKDMSILNGTLQILDPVERRGIRHPIDFFFRALAQDQGEKAVCIVLSGTGAEGTLGLKAIKGEGGLVIVQDPKTAKYDGMPGNAVATGLADYVLSPDQMPAYLLAFAKSPVLRLARPIGQDEAKPVDALQKIFVLIRAKTGHDFSRYKHNTVLRRVERRMAVLQIESQADYVAYLRNNPHEIDTLFKELLIRVTNFFRDPEAYETLLEKGLPIIFHDRPKNIPIRIWVPGCSTGEEAYSLAILFHEYNQKLKDKYKVQVFATDIDGGSIEMARSGIYPNSISADISSDRLNRYFTMRDKVYKIRDEIRETVIFAEHDVNKNPPFSKMDMISCRNLLIYMGVELQQRVVPLFRYALNPGGILFLGSSETIGDNTDLFTVVDKKWRIFKAYSSGIAPLTHINLRREAAPAVSTEKYRVPEGKKSRDISLDEVTKKILLSHHAPSCAVVDRDGTILFLRGRTGKYLEPASGKASLNILDMAREGLQPELQTAMRQASAKKGDIAVGGLQVTTDGRVQSINLTVHYVREPEQLSGLLVVVFTDVPATKAEKKTVSRGTVTERKLRQRIDELEFTVKSSKEHLQTIVEEMETSQEELQSSNEELQSANEELQSTNEEMETSKEELQSSNEELMTVNAELQNKMDDLDQVNNDMTNLLSSTKIATIFLDNDLCIKRYTPDATSVINLIQSDLGRPISDISMNIDYPALVQDAEAVLRTLTMKEMAIQHQEGAWYLARIMPYRTSTNIIDGVVITFVEITEQKRLQVSLQDALEFSQGIIDTVREPLIVLDARLRVLSANNAFYDMFRVSRKNTEQELIYNLGNRQWDIPALRKALEEILPQSHHLKDFVIEHDFQSIGRRKLLLNARRILSKGVATQTILVALEDITER